MNVLEYIKSKGITNFSGAAELMIGKKVKLLKATAGYGKGGDTFIINTWNNPNNSASLPANLNGAMLQGVSQYMPLANITLNLCSTVEEIKEDIALNLKQIEDLRCVNNELSTKMQFLQDNKLEKFDEDEFKVYAVLKELGRKSTPIQKAQAIAKLIKG